MAIEEYSEQKIVKFLWCSFKGTELSPHEKVKTEQTGKVKRRLKKNKKNLFLVSFRSDDVSGFFLCSYKLLQMSSMASPGTKKRPYN